MLAMSELGECSVQICHCDSDRVAIYKTANEPHKYSGMKELPLPSSARVNLDIQHRPHQTDDVG